METRWGRIFLGLLIGVAAVAAVLLLCSLCAPQEEQDGGFLVERQVTEVAV